MLQHASMHLHPAKPLWWSSCARVTRKFVCRQDAAPAALDIKFREDDTTDEDSDDSAAEPHIVMDLACGVFDLKVHACCNFA
jgi:hypothetical protein